MLGLTSCWVCKKTGALFQVSGPQTKHKRNEKLYPDVVKKAPEQSPFTSFI